MNKPPKYVATRNREITEVQWGDFGNTVSLLAGDLNEHIPKLKSKIEGNIIVPGSAGLVKSLLNAGFVDEINMIIHPVVLGSGNRYFNNMNSRNDMKLMDTHLYKESGSMRLRYEISTMTYKSSCLIGLLNNDRSRSRALRSWIYFSIQVSVCYSKRQINYFTCRESVGWVGFFTLTGTLKSSTLICPNPPVDWSTT